MSNAQSSNVAADREPVRRRTTPALRPIGAVRLPIAGPYRPWARLYRMPDGRLLWHVRLWERDRAVPHVVGTATLVAFARGARLTSLERELERLVRIATEGRRGGE
ncbi:MAG: hypothetical protein L3K10_04750 [Thermoplasmata archaeon]|nr:hypothetical protein [Thermoplasmata archaeon]